MPEGRPREGGTQSRKLDPACAGATFSGRGRRFSTSPAPDLARDLDDQAQLRALRLDRDVVAVHRAREAALRRQAELLERDVLRRLVDAALEVVLRFELAELGRHEAEHDRLALRQEAQRLEVTAARIVV